MDQRVVRYPSRSIDIRITEQECGDGDFGRAVAATLRHMAECMERDYENWLKAGYEPSGFVNHEVGVAEHRIPYQRIVFRPMAPASEETAERVITIEWAAADVHYPDDRPTPDNHLPHGKHDLAAGPAGGMTREEIIDGLTPAEREALGTWIVRGSKHGWKASNGEREVFVVGFLTDPAEVVEMMTDTLRKTEIIGADEEPTFYFED